MSFLLSCRANTDSKELISAKVDERVELLGIIFRLAGNEEYNQDDYEQYTNAIEAHFSAYRNHPVVQLAREVAAQDGVSYDAVMAMAVHVTSPPALEPLIPFINGLPEARWQTDKALHFARLLQSFYQEAHIQDFFSNQQTLYDTAEARFQQLLTRLDLDWFASYYGDMPDATFQLVIGLANGGGNYGPKVVYPNGKEILYAIIGTWETDTLGMPVYTADVLPIVVHEFSHSFVNSLIQKHEAQLEKAGKKLFTQAEEAMRAMAYSNWQTMIDEALVRAAVIRYYAQHQVSDKVVKAMIDEEKSKGFFWIEELYYLLETYESRREVYPDLTSFMPEIVRFYQKWED